MRSLKMRIFKNHDTAPDTTITIPVSVLSVAAKIIPKKAVAAIEEQGIDLKQIIALSQQEDINGTLLEIEEHKKNRRTLIALE